MSPYKPVVVYQSVFKLLDEVVDTRFAPEGYREPQWKVAGRFASMDWGALGGMFTVPSVEHPGKNTLAVLSPPPILPLIGQLHAEGWRRGGWHSYGGTWEVYAYLRRGGAEVRVFGSVYEGDGDGGRNTSWSYFSPPLLSRRRSLKAEWEEWERKGREDLW